MDNNITSNNLEDTPKRKENSIPSQVTPSSGSNVARAPEHVRDGFRYSHLNFDHEALLYTTLEVEELVEKMETFNFKYEGATAPRFALGEVDCEFGMCPHCHMYRWGCCKQKFDEYCVRAVKRFTQERYTRHISVKEAYIVFLNFYNRAMDFQYCCDCCSRNSKVST